jgi:hypothetical protein
LKPFLQIQINLYEIVRDESYVHIYQVGEYSQRMHLLYTRPHKFEYLSLANRTNDRDVDFAERPSVLYRHDPALSHENGN